MNNNVLYAIDEQPLQPCIGSPKHAAILASNANMFDKDLNVIQLCSPTRDMFFSYTIDETIEVPVLARAVPKKAIQDTKTALVKRSTKPSRETRTRVTRITFGAAVHVLDQGKQDRLLMPAGKLGPTLAFGKPFYGKDANPSKVDALITAHRKTANERRHRFGITVHLDLPVSKSQIPHLLPIFFHRFGTCGVLGEGEKWKRQAMEVTYGKKTKNSPKITRKPPQSKRKDTSPILAAYVVIKGE
jgi:hypothetical protein